MTAPTDLRVLHIGSGNYRPKDRAHATYAIWRELASGFRAYRVIARSVRAPGDWSDGNLRITLLPSFSHREAEFLLTQFIAVAKGIRDRPDVIVCQSPALGGLAALLIARLTGARVLMELHGAEFFSPSRLGSREWLLQKLSRFALHRADRIRVLSARMGELLAARYGASLVPRIRVVPPRVDLSRFHRSTKKRPLTNQPLQVVMVGTVNTNKGQLRLIRALKDVRFPIELHIVGSGPALADVRVQADRLDGKGSGLSVIFHGSLDHAAVAEVLRKMDVFVMYSRIEATPRAMMEAMASGLPIITTNAGFCADVVEHNCQGFVMGEDPDREVIYLLERIHKDRALAERIGEAARKRAHSDYDSVKLFNDYRLLIAETAAL